MQNFLKKEYQKFKKEGKEKNTKNNYARPIRSLNTFNLGLYKFFNQSIKKGDTLIDFGCGDKSLIKVLLDKEVRAKGYDYDQINLEDTKVPEENESVDYVTCISLIEHLYNPSNLLNEAFRILKKDGCLIIVTPNFTYHFKYFYDDPTHVNPFTTKKLEAVLNLHGFEKNHILPWVVNKPIIWDLPMNFFIAKHFLLFRGDTKLPVPAFLKGKTESILSISKKS